MIRVNVSLCDNRVSRVMISGHAGYDEFGRDIVCASASSIVITSVNAIVKVDCESIKYIIKDDLVDISILNNNSTTDILINNMIELLQDLEKKYSKNIKIYKEVH